VRGSAVKVLNSKGSGYTSWIVAGIDWVTARAGTIEVANMSLGGSGYSQAEYDAIQGAVKAGVAFAVSAGNSDADARNYSPAGFDNVLTVSALADFDGLPGALGSPTCRTDQDDTLADFSNWGPAVDIAAPGVCILSTYPLERGEYGAISGTSMASPHVAGALALLASRANPNNATDVGSLYSTLKGAGNLNWTDDSGDGIQERLLDVSSASTFNPVLVATGGTANSPPTSAFTYECVGLACSFTDGSSDSDGSVVSWSWTFGDGGNAATQNPDHTYAAAGTYTVGLVVTDDDGATGSTSRSINVSVVQPPTDFMLAVSVVKVKKDRYADLTWSGSSAGAIDVYKDGSVIAQDELNDGYYRDGPFTKGVNSAAYKVCESGTSTCSNEVTVSW